MGTASSARTSFLGGEWSKRAQGRFDRTDYPTAMAVCLNSIPIESGACVRRPGTAFAGATRNGGKGYVRSFAIKQAAAYTIELTAGFLRFRVGKALVTTNDDQTVAAISIANPAKVLTGTHGWPATFQVQFSGLGTNCPLLQNRVFAATQTSTTEFTLADALTGATIDGSTLGIAGAVGAKVARILEVASPYSGTLWQNVRVVQAETQAILLHPTVPPYILTAVPPGAGQTYYGFTLALANLLNGPYRDPPTNGVQLVPSALSGLVTLTIQFQAYDATRAYSVGDFVLSAGVNYQSIADQNQNHTPASSAGQWAAVSAGLGIGPNGFLASDIGRLLTVRRSDGFWTWGKIVAIANQVSQTLAGAVHIGTLTQGGGLAAAFDGTTSQTAAAGAGKEIDNTDPASAYVGQNFSGASAQKIGSATLWGSSDLGLVSAAKTYSTTTNTYFWNSAFWQLAGTSVTTATVTTTVARATVNLRAKHTAPASASDGTLLGSAAWTGQANVSIVSSDQATAWEYVWFEVVGAGVDVSVPPSADGRLTQAPVLGNTAFQYSSALTNFQMFFLVAEAQFFNPSGSGSGSAVTFQVLGNAGFESVAAHGTWRLGAYSNTTGWPTCGTYHENRLWLAGAIDNRVDASISNAVNGSSSLDFSPTDPLTAGTVLDSSAISAVFSAPDVNAIFWMETDQQGIICGTQAGDWLVQATANNLALTPTTTQAHRYRRFQSANIEPRRGAGGPLIVVDRFARKCLEYFPDSFSGKFAAANITWQMPHITKPGIAEIAAQSETTPIVWCRFADGSFAGITYKRENLLVTQPPNFAGGHRHALGSGRTVESIAVGPSVDGTLDALAMVTADPATGVRHVEILTNITEEADAPSSWWLLDDAVAPSSTLPIVPDTVINGTFFPLGGLTLNGLWHLNGRSVTVFACGLDCGEWVVTSGSINLPFGDGISAGTGGGLFTPALVASFASPPIVVGFTYTSDGQLTRPMTPQESGVRVGTALAKKRRVAQIGVLLENTVGGLVPETGSERTSLAVAVPPTPAGIQFGTSFDRLKAAELRTPDDVTALAYGTPFSGVFWTTIDDVSSFDGMLCWRTARPVAAHIPSIVAFLETHDK